MCVQQSLLKVIHIQIVLSHRCLQGQEDRHSERLVNLCYSLGCFVHIGQVPACSTSPGGLVLQEDSHGAGKMYFATLDAGDGREAV